jgi:hypothetical protein
MLIPILILALAGCSTSKVLVKNCRPLDGTVYDCEEIN